MWHIKDFSWLILSVLQKICGVSAKNVNKLTDFNTAISIPAPERLDVEEKKKKKMQIFVLEPLSPRTFFSVLTSFWKE